MSIVETFVQTVLSLFWNRDQRRLRTLWRLIGQGLLFGTFLIPLGGSLGLVMAGVTLAQGGNRIPAERTAELVTSLLTNWPLVSAAFTLISLVAMVASVWLAGRLLDRRPFADFGFHLSPAWWRDLGFGLALGAALMALIFLVEFSAGWLAVSDVFVAPAGGPPFALAIFFPLVQFVSVGIYEELFSRGYHLKNLAEGLNFRPLGPKGAVVAAMLLSSAIFGLLHVGNPNASPVSTFNIFLAGIFLAMGYVLTGELAIPIGVHIGWNFFQGNVFGFPVSGGDFSAVTFISIRQLGPPAMTGGAFGPEAGMLGLAALVIGSVLIVLWVQVTHGRAGFYEALAEPPSLPVAEREAGPVVTE
ncbi:MAG TPA: CPBP family intramembrane metalloprotease [Chloroflexi bacterium]|nr:CPBP family intramembrane metalloprotease [Chloroflexota bacterium]